LIQAFFDELRRLQRVKDGAVDADGDVAQPADGCWIGEEVVGENRVEIEKSMPISSAAPTRNSIASLWFKIICASMCARPSAS
jgi:hypothetical protein